MYCSLCKFVTFPPLCVSGVSECILITQWPRYIFSHLNNSIELNCYQNDTEYEYLYWYKQQKGGTIQMMASVVAGTADYEDEYKSGYQAVRLSKKQWTLTISRIQERDEAFYLCAASFAHVLGQDTEP
uniref:Ig-like domain-containing protein n=1 Tax=Gouania willdenowi TaxID=441366 RepID=A0A8C5DIL4_GOUWI